MIYLKTTSGVGEISPRPGIRIEELMANPYDYVAYDDQAQKELSEAKTIMVCLEDFLCRLGGKRVPYDIDIGSAQSHAEKSALETYFWIGKQIRDNQLIRNHSAAGVVP